MKSCIKRIGFEKVASAWTEQRNILRTHLLDCLTIKKELIDVQKYFRFFQFVFFQARIKFVRSSYFTNGKGYILCNHCLSFHRLIIFSILST